MNSFFTANCTFRCVCLNLGTKVKVLYNQFTGSKNGMKIVAKICMKLENLVYEY